MSFIYNNKTYNLVGNKVKTHSKGDWKQNFQFQRVDGACTILNGVASNFTSANRISPYGGNNNFTPSSASVNWEWVTTIETSDDITTYQVIQKINVSYGTSIYIGGDSYIYFRPSSSNKSYNIGTLKSLNPVAANTKYKITAKYNNGVFSLLIDDVEQATLESSAKIYAGDLRFAKNNGSNTDIFKGKIYLKESSLTIDNSIFWDYETDGICYVGNCFNYDTEKHTYTGTNKNVVISGKPFNVSYKPWIMRCKFKPSIDFSQNQNLFGTPNPELDKKLPNLQVYVKKFRLLLSSDGSNWDITTSNGITGNYTFDKESRKNTYKIELGWTGEKYYLKYEINNSGEWITDISFESTTPVYYEANAPFAIGSDFYSSSTNPFFGRIYLEDVELFTNVVFDSNNNPVAYIERYANEYLKDVYTESLRSLITPKLCKKWQVANSGINQTVIGSAFLNNKFLAITSNVENPIYSSTNGTNWELSNSILPENFAGVFSKVIAGGDKFLLCSNTNLYYYKPEEPKIQNVTLNSDYTIYNIAYKDGVYILVHDNTVASSTDGINWETWAGATIALNDDASLIGVSAEYFYYININHSFKIVYVYKLDTVNKTVTPMSSVSDIEISNPAIYGADKFIITNMGETTNSYIYSETGIDWQTGNFTHNIFPTSVIYANNQFIVFDYLAGQVLVSTDGINWNIEKMDFTADYEAPCSSNALIVAFAMAPNEGKAAYRTNELFKVGQKTY